MACAGAALKFELAVGLNGRVWVTAPDTTTTIMVANAIQHSEPLSDTQAHIFVKVRREAPQWTAMALTASSCERPGHQQSKGCCWYPSCILWSVKSLQLTVARPIVAAGQTRYPARAGAVGAGATSGG